MKSWIAPSPCWPNEAATITRAGHVDHGMAVLNLAFAERARSAVGAATRHFRALPLHPWVVFCRTAAVGRVAKLDHGPVSTSPADVDVRPDWQYPNPPRKQTSTPRGDLAGPRSQPSTTSPN
jgi:hypothetical protein